MSTVHTRLSGAGDYAAEVRSCPMRFVLSDDLTRLCTALAFSKGARTLSCADLLRVPSACVWVEWCEAPWQAELARYGFRSARRQTEPLLTRRRGALLRASSDGRRGWLRTFWEAGETDLAVHASSMEAEFDFDAPHDDVQTNGSADGTFRVRDPEAGTQDVLARYFRFRFESSWSGYYAAARLDPLRRAAVAHQALGTIAVAVPVLLAFFLLLNARGGLPRREQTLDRLNRSRLKAGKPALLDHVEVRSPLLLNDPRGPDDHEPGLRRSPRYHHVRGHVVRRGNQVFWRVPHVRGNGYSARLQSRTVTWNVGVEST